MEAALQRRIQRYGWDRAVDHYERLWSSQLKSAQERLVESAQLKPGARVLEISCGTGLVTWPLAARVGSTGKVIATDISERMVARTAAEAVSRGLSQVSCRRMGAESIDEPDASFDAVVCALGLMYVPEVATALGEMYRVTPAGRSCRRRRVGGASPVRVGRGVSDRRVAGRIGCLPDVLPSRDARHPR